MDKSKLDTGFNAEFVVGAVKPEQYPDDGLPEVAFAGRSNVGKSSLLNKLLNRRQLARVSNTPGRTRELNFFRINQAYYYVDLPGYGYAKVGRGQREVWDRGIGLYFNSRRDLRAVILLLDIRRGMTEQDQAMLDFIFKMGLPVLPVLTKSDKLNANPRREAIKAMRLMVAEKVPLAVAPLLVTSSSKGDGILELRQTLATLLQRELGVGDPPPPDPCP
ncbi:small GTP-binding protein [Magnetococcus marinus MC-1]|uniref:Probable GTP-binding protein EngB n=1 Tax=Magnetococcus marinus (strain ATCC BAA-1437 / JCM 17883 / MC-1) TaxID=156889 RepID=A0LDW1_MAGMM|nr:ribosome biogenesis GTP-binding protein YihA/YsxC [Magnetococcus marinus]ABK46154.1 small GTP-binding protein [Magnetococcus marinus MC-1]